LTELVSCLYFDFYKDLYSSVQIENDKIDEFLEHVNKTVDEDDKNMCDSDITSDEIIETLTAMSKNIIFNI
jgi:hypothetical protein